MKNVWWEYDSPHMLIAGKWMVYKTYLYWHWLKFLLLHTQIQNCIFWPENADLADLGSVMATSTIEKKT